MGWWSIANWVTTFASNLCSLQRRAVRNAIPNFVWTLRRDEGLYKTFDRSTFANHFAKASSFTTKVREKRNILV